ncbi:hypothetical protein LFX25_03500 [Leptospira sp. FAT2]|uniref:hypothetical protein n=1 Tax=Leptospira sanjuanensis TaxID=2879643 RepID=UPI001EE91075|nr:hypothetical protein [Leptospira sanjuanensis]MCG6192305.1 hypothetical protein [Leptospira sanjuanensis]
MKNRFLKTQVKQSKKGFGKSNPQPRVKPRFLKKLPSIDILFQNSINQRSAINAVLSLYSYVWDSLSITYAGYTQGICASLANAGISNVKDITDDVSLLVSEFSKYIGRADALDPKRANRILKKLSDKLANDLLYRNIDPWILRSVLLSKALYTWKKAGLQGVGDNYQVLRGQFDMTKSFRKLQKATFQAYEYFNDPTKENRDLIRALVEAGWALSYRDFRHLEAQ